MNSRQKPGKSDRVEDSSQTDREKSFESLYSRHFRLVFTEQNSLEMEQICVVFEFRDDFIQSISVFSLTHNK